MLPLWRNPEVRSNGGNSILQATLKTMPSVSGFSIA
jgi:hypothetical protein